MRTQRRNTPPIFRRNPLVMALAFALMPGVSAAFVVTDPGDNLGIDPAPGAKPPETTNIAATTLSGSMPD